MSNFILPNHNLTASEWKLVPAALYELFKARLRVSLLKSEHYLPTGQPDEFIPVDNINYKVALDIAIVVNGIARRTPWRSTCLVKALAAHHLLLNNNIPHTFHFGLQKTPTKELKAHAWLSVGSRIIVGGEEANDFHEIRRINAR